MNQLIELKFFLFNTCRWTSSTIGEPRGWQQQQVRFAFNVPGINQFKLVNDRNLNPYIKLMIDEAKKWCWPFIIYTTECGVTHTRSGKENLFKVRKTLGGKLSGSLLCSLWISLVEEAVDPSKIGDGCGPRCVIKLPTGHLSTIGEPRRGQCTKCWWWSHFLLFRPRHPTNTSSNDETGPQRYK